MNSENGKTSDLHRLLLNLSDKNTLYIYVFFIKSQQIPYMKKYKKDTKNNKFKISAPSWNEKFQLKDRPYPVLDIQVYLSISSKNMKQ